MDWKAKCAAFYALRVMPRAIYHLAQKKVTGRYLDSFDAELASVHALHRDVFRSIPAATTALEFGAGRNLLGALMLRSAGAAEVFAYDISRLATLLHVNHVIRQLRHTEPGRDWPEVNDLDADLYAKYRIRYVAPGDARATELPDSSVDLVCSTSTLEHIAREDIEKILEECARICKPSGRLSFIIDYHDHYATSDPTITRFNFYKYSAWKWGLFNPRNHFQNRLRHSDYEKLFASFRILKSEAIVPDADEAALASVPLAPEFRMYSRDDLLALNGIFVLGLT